VAQGLSHYIFERLYTANCIIESVQFAKWQHYSAEVSGVPALPVVMLLFCKQNGAVYYTALNCVVGIIWRKLEKMPLPTNLLRGYCVTSESVFLFFFCFFSVIAV